MNIGELKAKKAVGSLNRLLSQGGNQVKRPLPIGNDDFRDIRENGLYYVDKTLMIKDFIEMKDKLALVTRPRRFGKTLSMTMIRDFFDITQDSRDIFNGLAIMETEYAELINSRPVIYLTFKDCKERTAQDLLIRIKRSLCQEYSRYDEIWCNKLNIGSTITKNFYTMMDSLRDPLASYAFCSDAILWLTQVIKKEYGVSPILLIDEYDQPIMSSYQYGYRDEIGNFFSNLYGLAMKGNPALGQALLTGVQRVAKESIFSHFNNAQVYTVIDTQYAPYFGLTLPETKQLLADYGLGLDENVEKKYDGYLFGGIPMYNPWSVLNYTKRKVLDNYWVNTSTNSLIKELLANADKKFWSDFDELASGVEVPITLTLETSYAEREGNLSLWGLLVNAGYLTAVERIDAKSVLAKIPNDEVMDEFKMIVTEISGIKGTDLGKMFKHLLNKEMEAFIAVYRDIVLSCTSYMDAKENAYHMLFLGMSMYLIGLYDIKSNTESGHGRPDIRMEAVKPSYQHIVIEFKQGKEKELDRLKEEALQQIIDNEYYAGLKGEVLCIGIAHGKKHCQIANKVLNVTTVLQSEIKGQEDADSEMRRILDEV